MADLKGSVALVTGASGPLGRGIAQGLAEAGATLYLAAADGDEPASVEAMQITVREVDEFGGRAIPLIGDRADTTMQEYLRRIESESGRLDLLVNNFPTPPLPDGVGKFWNQPLTVWEDVCALALRRCYVASALATRLMVEAGHGLIIHLAGRYPAVAGAGAGQRIPRGVYLAGLDRMAQEMAAELDGHGVTALSLNPGFPHGEWSEESQIHRSPRYAGRCIAALAMDPDVMEKTGGSFHVETLRKEYRFSDVARESAQDTS